MKESIIPDAYCPKCNRLTDRMTAIKGNNAIPKPGTLSVCICCGALNKFREDLQLSEVGHFELQTIKQRDPKAYKVIKQAQRYIQKRRSKGDWIK